jgi:hypothetical protein
MKYAVEIGSIGMMCIPRFIKIGSAIQTLLWEYTDTQTTWCSHKRTFIFSKYGK